MPTLWNAISEVYRISKTYGNNFVEQNQKKREWRNHFHTYLPSWSIASYFYILIPANYNCHATVYFANGFRNKLPLGKSTKHLENTTLITKLMCLH